MSELELKFRLPDEALAPLQAALHAHRAGRLRLQARYYDTGDGRLARHAIALRLRLEGRRWVQTLKAAGDGAVHRLEHEVPVPGAAGAVPALDPHRHAGSDAGAALDGALDGAPADALVERHATDVVRLHLTVEDAAGSRIEIALDTGSARARGRTAPIVEVELEHKGGPVDGLFDLAAAWVRHGGLWLSTVTKAERGERLLESPRSRARGAQKPRFDPDPDGPTLLRALLQSTLQQVLANASEVAEGDEDAETIHQLRVGLRRLRTVLRELAALSPAIPPSWDAALGATFDLLGQRRDRQAVAEAVRPLLEEAGAPRTDWEAAPTADPAAAVRERTFQATLVEILGLAHAGAERFAPLGPKAARALVGERLAELHHRVLHAGRRFEQLEFERQHRARKQVKRLRYLAELTGPLWPREPLRRYLKRLARAQDALGRHNDVAVGAAAFRADAAAHPESWFAAGWLQAHLAVTARAAHAALAKADAAPPFRD